MAVVLQSAPRVLPAPCEHRLATIVVDGGREITVVVTPEDLVGPIEDEEIRAVLKLWARYHMGRGVSLGALLGGTIFAEIA